MGEIISRIRPASGTHSGYVCSWIGTKYESARESKPGSVKQGIIIEAGPMCAFD